MRNLLWLLITGSIILSCNRDSWGNYGAGDFSFSTDTLKFDTVFTSIGTITQKIKVFNHTGNNISFQQIFLGGAHQSLYRMNINGQPGHTFNNVEILPNDSIYVFISLVPTVNEELLPFLIHDSVGFLQNGTYKYLQLEAFGQNALFIKDSIFQGEVVLPNQLPLVITGNLLVDEQATLTMLPGTRLFFHSNASFVVDGQLIANGTVEAPVTMKGYRLDPPYNILPGSWKGIEMSDKSHDHQLTNVHIENARNAVRITGTGNMALPQLIIKQSIIHTTEQAGIHARSSHIYVENSLIYNNGINIQIEGGGDYHFVHNTIASYSTLYQLHRTPGIYMSDFIPDESSSTVLPLAVRFENSIIWGDLQEELQVDLAGTQYNIVLDHVIYKGSTDHQIIYINSVVEDPQFEGIDISKNLFNFKLQPISPGINFGKDISVYIDLAGSARNMPPDLGCYEWIIQEE